MLIAYFEGLPKSTFHNYLSGMKHFVRVSFQSEVPKSLKPKKMENVFNCLYPFLGQMSMDSSLLVHIIWKL